MIEWIQNNICMIIGISISLFFQIAIFAENNIEFNKEMSRRKKIFIKLCNNYKNQGSYTDHESEI